MPDDGQLFGIISMRIKKSRVAKGIYLLRFRTQYELAATFLRVQEHYGI